MSKVLVVVGHPNLSSSSYNSRLADAVKSLPNVTVHKVDANYPINMQAEQNLLVNHDVVVLQFPMHWYSTPAILKEWIDKVITFGFAFGPGGDKLEKKKILLAVTTGGAAASYNKSVYGFTAEETLVSLKGLCTYVRAEYKGLFLVNGCMPGQDFTISENDFAKKLEEYKKLIASL